MSDGDIAFALDLFHDVGALTHRKMFGGICLYQDGTVFALQSSSGQLFLKTKTPEDLFGDVTEQFHNMPYYAIPEDILDDPQSACAAAHRAIITLNAD